MKLSWPHIKKVIIPEFILLLLEISWPHIKKVVNELSGRVGPQGGFLQRHSDRKTDKQNMLFKSAQVNSRILMMFGHRRRTSHDKQSVICNQCHSILSYSYLLHSAPFTIVILTFMFIILKVSSHITP